MNAAERTHKDVTTLYNITHSLHSSLSYQQIVLLIWSILANLQDSLYYMQEVTIHTMDYIDTAPTGILSPHVSTIEEFREMLSHIEETLPSKMHLPISSEDVLHFYRHLYAHILIADEKFLFLIDVPIQDHAQQLEIYKVFNLAIPHGNFSAHYSIQNIYLGIMQDETKAVEISEDQFKTYKKANGQFCSLNTLLLPLDSPPTCVSALYAKDKASIQKWCSLQIRKASSISTPTSIALNVWIITSPTAAVPPGITLICPGQAPRSVIPQAPIHILQLQPACSATSQHFHLPPCYESHEITVNISLNTANLNVINISAPEFIIWHHLEDHWNGTLLHHLVNIPSVPIDKLYKQMVNSNGPINLFLSTDESIGRNSFSLNTIFSCRSLCNSYRITHTSRIRDILLLLLLVPTCQISVPTFTIRFYMIYYSELLCRGSTHLQMWWQGWTAYSKTLWESWPAYGIGTYMDRVDRSNRFSLEQFLHPDHWIPPKSRECIKNIWSVVRLRFGPVASSPKQFDGLTLKDNSCFTHHQVYHWYPFIHNNSFTFEDAHAYGTCQQINGDMPLTSDWINQALFGHINTVNFNSKYKPCTTCTQHHSVIQLNSGSLFIMDTTDYWLFASKYSIWKAAVAALQFWMVDLDPQMLRNAIEWVYTAFFCSNSAQHLRNISEEILFGHFMTTLNDTFE